MDAFRELSGLPTPVMKDSDLAAIARQSMKNLGLEGFCAIAPSLTGQAMAFTDPILLELILVNLIQNAREAGAASLSITLGQEWIELADTGPGLPGPLLSAIKAQTLQPGYTTKPGSKGMGLFIITELCAALGISLGVESFGSGTRFRLEFDHGGA
jgi:signal transduction histidine kinase